MQEYLAHVRRAGRAPKASSLCSAVVTLTPCRSGTLRLFPVAAVTLRLLPVFLARRLPRSLGAVVTQADPDNAPQDVTLLLPGYPLPGTRT